MRPFYFSHILFGFEGHEIGGVWQGVVVKIFRKGLIGIYTVKARFYLCSML